MKYMISMKEHERELKIPKNSHSCKNSARRGPVQKVNPTNIVADKIGNWTKLEILV